MDQFEDEASCRAYHLGLGKDTFLLKGKDLMGYVTEQIRLWSEKRQLIQQREDKIKEADLARENAEREIALARENAERQAILDRENAERALAEQAAERAHKLDMIRIRAENGDPGNVVPEYQKMHSGDLVRWSCLHLITRQKTSMNISTSSRGLPQRSSCHPVTG